MKFIGTFKKMPKGGIGFVEKLPGAPRPKFFSPPFLAIYYPNASCYLSLWVVVICSGYPHCAPLERGGWTYRHSIDIPPRWSGIYAAVKIGIGGCKSSIVSFALEERKAEQINDNNQPKTTPSIYTHESRTHGSGAVHRHEGSKRDVEMYCFKWELPPDFLRPLLSSESSNPR